MMTERLKELGLMKGNVDEAVRAGAHAMFLPHGLGHMMGMDVHDMEGLGQIYVGFDDETRPNLEQFGTNCLRMGRKLEEGFVVTDEPGIYFIPALIDEWKASSHCKDFLCFDKLDESAVAAGTGEAVSYESMTQMSAASTTTHPTTAMV